MERPRTVQSRQLFNEEQGQTSGADDGAHEHALGLQHHAGVEAHVLIDGLCEATGAGPRHRCMAGEPSRYPYVCCGPAPTDLKEERDQAQLAQALDVRNVVRQVVHDSGDDAQAGTLDGHRARMSGVLVNPARHGGAW